MTKIRVLLADDHKMMREGIRMLLAAQSDIEVVGEADTGRTALAMARQFKPHVVLMDVSMPVMNGLDATKAMFGTQPGIKVLVLTRLADGAYLHELLNAGARGYLLKQSASEELVRAIRAVAGGQMYLDPAMTDKAVGPLAGGAVVRGALEGKSLTQRESAVLRFVAWGLLNKEIATRLDLSVKTIEAHRANGMTKLGFKSRIDVVRYAMLQGWLRQDV